MGSMKTSYLQDDRYKSDINLYKYKPTLLQGILTLPLEV